MITNFKIRSGYFILFIIFLLFFPKVNFAYQVSFEKARKNYRIEEYKAALQYLNLALFKLDQNKNNPIKTISVWKAKIYKLIGDCHNKLKDNEFARIHYQKSLAYDENQPDLLFYLASLYEKRRHYKASQSYWKKYLMQTKGKQHNRQNTKAIFRYAIILAHLGERKKSFEILSKISNKKVAPIIQCTELEGQNNYYEAENCYYTLIYAYPMDIRIYQGFIRVYTMISKRSKNQKIKDASLKSIKTWGQKLYLLWGDKPQYIWPYFFILYQERSYKKAIRLLKEILESKPNESLAYLMLTEIAYEQDRSEKALKYFNKAKELNVQTN